MITRELCVENFDQAFGRDVNFIELCDNLAVGGTTPSYGVLYQAQKQIATPITVLIRARGGDFVYTDAEIEIMSQDISICEKLNFKSVRVGALTKDNLLDESSMTHWKSLAKSMGISCHMAFDEVQDYFYAIDQLVDWGYDGILTKGHSTQKAPANTEMLKKLVDYANGRLTIIPGAGVTIDNYIEIAKITGATRLHGTKIL